MGSADLVMRVNALGTILVHQALFPIAQPGMGVVDVASVAGHQLPAFLTPVWNYKRSTTDTDRGCSPSWSKCATWPLERVDRS